MPYKCAGYGWRDHLGFEIKCLCGLRNGDFADEGAQAG